MNTNLLFDKFAYVDRLRHAGVDEALARAHGDGLEQALREEVATKSDIAEVKAEMKSVEAALTTKIDRVEASLKTDLAKLETRIVLWLVGLLITTIPIGAALAAFVFKHIP